MQRKKCTHFWEMTNIASGLVVMAKCFHCGGVSSCFCPENQMPMESSQEGSHFWNFMEGEQTFHFDLKCVKCGTLVKLDEMAGLMQCTGCDESCAVCVLKQKLEPQHTKVFIALGCRPSGERGLTSKKIAILETYFNQHQKSLKSKAKIVPLEKVKSIDNCYAEALKDTESLSAASRKRI